MLDRTITVLCKARLRQYADFDRTTFAGLVPWCRMLWQAVSNHPGNDQRLHEMAFLAVVVVVDAFAFACSRMCEAFGVMEWNKFYF